MLFNGSYNRAILRLRHTKDRAFQTDPDSPIPWEERRQFSGLRYFPPNRAYHLTARVTPLDDDQPITLATSDGQEQPYRRQAMLRLVIDRHPYQLVAYRSLREHNHHPESLFVPFRDTLAGQETYGSGRYLDIEWEPRARRDTLIVDFNLAYNPYCAYSLDYSCPIPPRENWLTCPIRAGERMFHTS